jgi:predicted NBD/HSP70 family sugar kinase
MTELRTADRGDIRDLNILAVINLMRRGGSTTRATIARETGLSAPTVSAVVATLSRAGLVDVSGAGPATGGRRGELIVFRPDAKLVLAIDLSCEPRRCALLDLTKQVVPGSVADLPEEALTTPEHLARWVADRLRSCPQVVGIGVAAPGVTNSNEGIIEWAPSLGWRDARVKADLQAAAPGLAVTVENDLNLAALAEYALGEAGWTDLAMLGLRGGFGAGVILGGKLHRGVNFAAGELGYLPAPFGQPGTLDFGALEATLFSMLPDRGAPCLEPGQNRTPAPAGPVLDAADVTRVVDILAYGSFALAVVLDVSGIVLGEELLILVPNLDRVLEQRLAAALPHPPRVIPSFLGAFGTLQGAATAVQQETDVRRLLS